MASLPEMRRTEMSSQFHQYVRHIVSCPDGHVREKLEAIRDEIYAEIGPEPEGLEDPIKHQRRLELSYVQGYLSGPGASMNDITYSQEQIAEHQEATKPKQRRIKHRQ